MGANNSSGSKNININDILNEKEYIFLILQTEIDNILRHRNKRRTLDDLSYLQKEINSHIAELKGLIECKKWKDETIERGNRLIYNYEISLAKVKSIFNTVSKRKRNNDVQNEQNIADTPNVVRKEIPHHETSPVNISPNDQEYAQSDLMDFSSVDEDVESEYIDEVTYANLKDLCRPSNESQSSKSDNSRRSSKKKPIPSPRNKDAALVKEVPRYFERLNEILEKESVDSNDIEEVLHIRMNANDVKNALENKIEEIFRRYKENVEGNISSD
ncbi:hypothetical protein NQ318_004871 [Aromia moschata]|uniref:Uncharacterized protein n=1 Tax=Aromia moschata TaxID=1265417 RepID=A0AAV8Z2P5_9CUCU|nr:hypothetical protein NQ318_004871 [Aromia moschata]